MTVENMPAAEVVVDRTLVRALLGEQHPDLAHLPLRPLGSGWDNVTFRLGDDLTVRVPRREAAAVLIEHEQRWLPEIAPHLPLATPVPVYVGLPSALFRWHWTVGPWLAGDVAARSAPQDELVAAETLGGFLHELHRPAPADAPPNPYRGVPLRDRDEVTRERMGQLASIVDVAAVIHLWDAALEVPPFVDAPLWLHGDLHPANLLVHRGRISAVIDFGDITAGDPATDLAVAWMLFGPAGRERFRDSTGVGGDGATWSRARGWALSLALAYLASSADNATMAAIGHRTLAAVLADRSGGDP